MEVRDSGGAGSRRRTEEGALGLDDARNEDSVAEDLAGRNPAIAGRTSSGRYGEPLAVSRSSRPADAPIYFATSSCPISSPPPTAYPPTSSELGKYWDGGFYVWIAEFGLPTPRAAVGNVAFFLSSRLMRHVAAHRRPGDPESWCRTWRCAPLSSSNDLVRAPGSRSGLPHDRATVVLIRSGSTSALVHESLFLLLALAAFDRPSASGGCWPGWPDALRPHAQMDRPRAGAAVIYLERRRYDLRQIRPGLSPRPDRSGWLPNG